MEKIAGFIKVGMEEHIDNLLERGLIFCNTLDYFRTIENDDKYLRKDIREGSINDINNLNIQVLVDNKSLPINFTSTRFYQYDPLILSNHLYCLFSIRSKYVSFGKFIDQRLKNFGLSSLLITDYQKFIDRIIDKLKSENVKFEMEFVKYYKKNSNPQNLSIFDKPNEFEFQNEFRLFVKGQKNSTFSFEIGSLKDIAIKVDSSNLDLMTLEVEPLRSKHSPC